MTDDMVSTSSTGDGTTGDGTTGDGTTGDGSTGDGSTGDGSTGATDDVTAVRYEQDADGIVTLTLDDPTASANTMNELYQRSMHAAVDRLYDDVEGVTGVVIASAKKTFFAGGNLTLMMQATPDDAPSLFAGVEAIKADLRRLEKLPRPVVAAINGAA